MLENIGSLNLIISGIFVFVSGIILFGRWIAVKSTQVSARRKEQPSQESIERKLQGVEGGKIFPTDKWRALVEYDNEIRAAAERVRGRLG